MGSIPGPRRSPWRRKWQPTPVFLPGKSYQQRSLAGYSPWGRKELDTTEWLTYTHIIFISYICISCTFKRKLFCVLSIGKKYQIFSLLVLFLKIVSPLLYSSLVIWSSLHILYMFHLNQSSSEEREPSATTLVSLDTDYFPHQYHLWLYYQIFNFYFLPPLNFLATEPPAELW